MRKRRVLALLLALSLVVSGNGMTVLAAEQGADMPVLATQEEAQETDDKLEEKEDTPDHTEQTPETGEQSEETETPAEGEVSDEDGKTEPGNTPEKAPKIPRILRIQKIPGRAILPCRRKMMPDRTGIRRP